MSGSKPFLRFVRLFIVLIISFLVLGLSFWAIFYSTFLANFSFIIGARNWYSEAFWNTQTIIFPNQRPVPAYTLQVAAKSRDGQYFLYTIFGIIDHVDQFSNNIYIKGFDSKEYVFQIDSINAAIFINSLAQKMQFINVDLDKSFADKGIVVQVRWADKKTLRQYFSGTQFNMPTVPISIDIIN